MVITLIIIGLEALFIWFAWQGRNWARIVLWVLGGLGVVFGFVGPAAGTGATTGFLTSLAWFQLLLSAVGIVLLALKPSNDWYRYRGWQRANGQGTPAGPGPPAPRSGAGAQLGNQAPVVRASRLVTAETDSTSTQQRDRHAADGRHDKSDSTASRTRPTPRSSAPRAGAAAGTTRRGQAAPRPRGRAAALMSTYRAASACVKSGGAAPAPRRARRARAT